MTKYLSGLLLTYILFAGSLAYAQLPQRVTDLNPLRGSTAPQHLTSFNNKLYFSGNDGNTGMELWSYDGSTSRPTQVVEMAPGLTDGIGSSEGASFPVLNGKMYFPGHLPSTPFWFSQLFSYDGINLPVRAPGIADSILLGTSDFITFGNRIFFAAGTPTTNIELYAYDGLSAPTVYEINPDSASFPHAFTEFNGKLYFLATANFTTQGEELFMYDPATDQCSLVADINPGRGGSFCQGFTVAGNKMYFIAFTAGYGTELWQYDGTTVTRLTDLAPGAQNGLYYSLGYFRGNIIFGGSTDGFFYFPYKYDVSTGQAVCISNDSTSLGSAPTSYKEYKGNLYFGTGDGAYLPPIKGNELWKYDGINLSVMPEICPGRLGSRPGNYIVHNGYLYFTAQDTTYGNELYRLYDPTSVVNTAFDGEVKLFPNPAATHATLEVTLKSSQQLSISIADMTGKEVYTTGIRAFGSGRNEISIPLQSYACGSYSYQLMNSAGQRMAAGIMIKE